jgi:hypothetical protein
MVNESKWFIIKSTFYRLHCIERELLKEYELWEDNDMRRRAIAWSGIRLNDYGGKNSSRDSWSSGRGSNQVPLKYESWVLRFAKTEYLTTRAEVEKWYMKLHSTLLDYMWHNELEEESI